MISRNPSDELLRAVIIAGPTGSGKSALAMALAGLTELPDIEIVSADSRQVYREMDIGTDKPTPEDRARVPHHMLDVVTPDRRFSAGAYARDALDCIREILRRGHLPLVVGGTGLYIRALVHGLADVPPAQRDLRRKLEETLRVKGPEHLHKELARRDPARAAAIQPGDAYRIIRALEILDRHPEDVTSAYQKHGFRPIQLKPLMFVLNVPRPILYNRIERRVDRMIRRGLESEVRELLQRYGSEAPGLSGIGYRQMVAYINGEISHEEAVRIIKRDTRRFAKRQLTWFRKEKEAIWVDYNPEEPTTGIIEWITKRIAAFWA